MCVCVAVYVCVCVCVCTSIGICLFVGCLTSQQHASVSQGRICTDNFTCCHTEIEAADQTFHLTQSQYTDTGPTSPSTDPIMPGAWQGSHWSANVLSHWYDSTPKKSCRKRDSNLGPSALEAGALTTRPTRRSSIGKGNRVNVNWNLHHLHVTDILSTFQLLTTFIDPYLSHFSSEWNGF